MESCGTTYVIYVCNTLYPPPTSQKFTLRVFLKFLQDSCFSTPLSVWNNFPGPEFRFQSRGWVVGVVWNDVIYVCGTLDPPPTSQKFTLRVFLKFLKTPLSTHRFQCRLVSPGLNFVSSRGGGWLESCGATLCIFVQIINPLPPRKTSKTR